MSEKMSDHLTLGELGETIACKYLQKKGYRILERRFTNTKGRRLGEIDIIAQDRKTIVFVEVKTRSFQEDRVLLPEENINHYKLRKLEKIAQVYLIQKRMQNTPYRFDALSILYKKLQKKALVKHIESIFL